MGNPARKKDQELKTEDPDRRKEGTLVGSYLESEKTRQVQFKHSSDTISERGKAAGLFRGIPRPFCLPPECAEENLFPPIRQSAIAFFREHAISWHQGQDGKPSNHLCSSQVACVNFLFPFANQPEELARLFKAIYPQIERMIPVEEGQYVSFEWIGGENYLGERTVKSGARTRGANFTSADAIVLFEDKEKKRKAVLIEWKYTESYGSTYLGISESGTDRREIYKHLFADTEGLIDKALLPNIDALYYEPFYQLMRQQFLAAKMERAHELGADEVGLLHISPEANYDFKRNTSPKLSGIGGTPTEIWKKLVKMDSRFTSIHTEDLMREFRSDGMQSWKAYMQERYHWIG